jgi:class 3 adenylate cyclase
VAGELSPDVWHFAQLGLVDVAYQLRRINHRLKVFAAVRKEAYARLQTTVMAQQYRGSAIDIVYPIESLREIFINNVRLEKPDRMIRPERLRTNPVEAFLGRTSITDIYTGLQEDAFEYLCRHTLLRPRDLMTIGERLATLRPEERANEYRLKEAVNQAATEIAQEYLVEIAPYVAGLNLEHVLHRLPGHVLTRDELEELFRTHNATRDPLEAQHVFCALYQVGLLGHVHHDWVRGEWVQRFLRPGEGTLQPDGVLPAAEHYIVHPVLSEVIGRFNPLYLQRIDRVNIVGHGVPWRATPRVDRTVASGMLFVLAGDIHGFGGLMRARVDAPVRQALEEAVRKWAQGAVCAETSAGDAVFIVHDDPVELARAGRHIIDEVYRAPGQPRLRIALHYGEVLTRRREGDAAVIVVGGEAVLCAARVEPHVQPGQIWTTEEFREQLARQPSLWRTTPATGPGGDERFNVKKEGNTEPDLWVRLYRLEF